jgi:hypothetical protein
LRRRSGDTLTLVARRLAAQKLNGRRLRSSEKVVAWLGGVQAQDYRGGKWSIGLRSDGVTNQDVEEALADHRIIRTWMFRGTLHFVAAADLGWLTALLAPGIIRGNRRRYGQLDLDGKVFRKSRSVIRKAIEADGPLTRPELKKYFVAAGVPAEGQQVPYLLQRAALDGLICSGPQRGREAVYGLTSEWVGAQPELDREPALGQLAERYFNSHGPATETDFAWWAGLSKTDVRKAVAAARKVEAEVIEEVTYLRAGSGSASRSGGAALLPPFDDYLLGYKDRDAMLDPAFAKRVNRGGGIPKPAVLVDGAVIGVWSRSEKKGDLVIEIEPFQRLGSAERSRIEAGAERLGRFESLAVEIALSQEEDSK